MDKKYTDKARVIRLITEVGDHAKWSAVNKNAWYAEWRENPELAVKVLESLWKSWNTGKYGVI